jgi:hypothetical protein
MGASGSLGDVIGWFNFRVADPKLNIEAASQQDALRVRGSGQKASACHLPAACIAVKLAAIMQYR